MQVKDYYRILGVEPTATGAEIKKAYRTLARKYHPDVSKLKDAEERFKEIAEAYETLKDPRKRNAYDRLGGLRAGQGFRPAPDWEQQFDDFFGSDEASSPFDLGDLFAMFKDGARPGANHDFSARGRDVEVTAHISLEEAARGTELTFEFCELAPSGSHSQPQRVTRTARARIPKGATHGQKLRAPGKGGHGSHGAPAGDLYITIALRPHPLFRVADHDLTLDLPVTPWEAALGASVEIPTLDGPLKLRIPPGTQSGQKLRIAGRGLPKPHGGHGDLYAQLRIVTPSVLSEREKQLYSELARASSFEPRGHFA